MSSANLGLLGQCQNIAPDQCLHIMIKAGVLYLGFYMDDAFGTTQLTTDVWYHVAFVYSRSLPIQLIYLNGRIEGSRVPSTGYAGIMNQFLIGAVRLGYGLAPFSGYIDEMIFVSRVKNATEILDEATLVAHCSFDNTLLDSGPNSFKNMTGVDVLFDPAGRLSQALLINSTNSYFQVFGFYYLGQSNYSYSFSLWIYPFATNGTILQVWFIRDVVSDYTSENEMGWFSIISLDFLSTWHSAYWCALSKDLNQWCVGIP